MNTTKRALARIGAANADAYVAFVAGLSAETKRQRMLGAGIQLNPQLLEKALASVPGESAVWGIFQGEKLLAVGRYAVDSQEEKAAEFAITVADECHGFGFGTTLLKTLKLFAAQDGYRTLTGLAFATNDAMIGLARAQGFSCAPDADDACLVKMACSLLPNASALKPEPAPFDLPV